MRERAVLADEAGFETVWVFDHFSPLYGDPKGPCLEGWTLLAAIAEATSRVRLGTLVTGVTYREPALLAAEAVTVDHVSNGRLEIGLGAAWKADEHEALGFRFPPTSERMDRLEEAVEVIKLLMTGEDVDYDGEHYQLRKATYRPLPVQRPHPPIWIGGSGERRTMPLVARVADAWHGFATAEDALRKAAYLDELCEQAGRDPSEVRRSASLSLSQPWDRVHSDVEAFAAAGYTHLMVSWPTEGRARLEEFVTDHMSELSQVGEDS